MKQIYCINGSILNKKKKKNKIYCDDDDKNCFDDSKKFCNLNENENIIFIIIFILFFIIFTIFISYYLKK